MVKPSFSRAIPSFLAAFPGPRNSYQVKLERESNPKDRVLMHHKCRGKKANGTACGAPAHLLDEEGFCPTHRPGGRETMAERGWKGGLATKRKAASPGLDPEELPELRTHVDALNLA